MKFIFIAFLFSFPFFYFAQEKSLNSQEISKNHFNSIVKILMFDSIAEKAVRPPQIHHLDFLPEIL